MIDIAALRENPDKFRKATSDKNMDTSVVDQILALDEKRRALIKQTENLRAERNKWSSLKSPNLPKNLKKDGETIREQGKRFKDQLKALEPQLNEVDAEFNKLIHLIPNPAADDVKIGKGDAENEEIRTWGDKPKFDFEPKNHLDLGTELGILDFENGAKVSGSQFYYLSGDAVLLELALLQFGIDFLAQKGFRPYITPDLAKSRYYLGTGYQPKGEEAQIYEIDGEDLGLIATAEVTMAGLHADEVLSKKELPLRYAAISHCFRKEAGAYGKYSKGLYRVHQFTKLEMFVYCTPDKSEEIHEELLKIEEEMIQALGIPYRVLKMCTGDLGAIASKKYDLEAWMPGRNDYGEITSTSNTTDYQARNLNIKFNDGTKNEYAHLLNGTAFALSRIPIAILENFQQKDGSVLVPEVLQKWMGKDKIEKQ